MNYEPNTKQWKVGDIVIHDADAKRREMLMIVVGYGRGGRCKTQYLSQNNINGGRKTIWRNPITSLHDPALFGLVIEDRETGVAVPRA